MTIGERIKEARKAAKNGKGMTQKELGEACGINEANIRKYENGRQNPKYETLQKIASALDVNVTDLLGIFGNTILDNKENSSKLPQNVSPHFEEPIDPKAVLSEDDEYIKIGTKTEGYLFRKSYYQPKERINKAFDQLNEEGQWKAVKHVEELAKDPRYQESPDKPAQK